MTFAHDLAKTVKKQLKAAKPPVYEMNQLESETKVDFKDGRVFPLTIRSNGLCSV